MSFTRTLAKLAAGFAVAKGVDKFRRMGGMSGLQKQMEGNPAMAGMQANMAQMMERFGLGAAGGSAGGPGLGGGGAGGGFGGAGGFQKMMDQWTSQTDRASGGMAAGLGSLIAAMGGATAAGAEQSGKMMDAMAGNAATTDAMEENAKLMIRAMIQAARADGEIDDDERARIMEHLGDLDASERAFVEAEMARPIDPNALAVDTGEQMKAQVYAMSVMAVKVDTQAEASYLDGLAAALGLSDDTRRRVHAAMGVS